MRLAAAVGEEPEELRLAAPVGAEHRDPIAVEDLAVERLHEAGDAETRAGDRTHAGAAAAEAHRDLLAAGRLLGRAGFLELADPGLHRPVARRHHLGDGGLLLQRRQQLAEPVTLLGPAAQHLRQSLVARLAGVVVGVEADPPWVQAERPSTVTTRSAVRASSSRSWLTYSTVFGVARSRSSSHSLPGTSR